MNFPTPRIQNSYVITYEKKVWWFVQYYGMFFSAVSKHPAGRVVEPGNTRIHYHIYQ